MRLSNQLNVHEHFLSKHKKKPTLYWWCGSDFGVTLTKSKSSKASTTGLAISTSIHPIKT